MARAMVLLDDRLDIFCQSRHFHDRQRVQLVHGIEGDHGLRSGMPPFATARLLRNTECARKGTPAETLGILSSNQALRCQSVASIDLAHQPKSSPFSCSISLPRARDWELEGRWPRNRGIEP